MIFILTQLMIFLMHFDNLFIIIIEKEILEWNPKECKRFEDAKPILSEVRKKGRNSHFTLLKDTLKDYGWFWDNFRATRGARTRLQKYLGSKVMFEQLEKEQPLMDPNGKDNELII